MLLVLHLKSVIDEEEITLSEPATVSYDLNYYTVVMVAKDIVEGVVLLGFFSIPRFTWSENADSC